jgi:hypothetical protein
MVPRKISQPGTIGGKLRGRVEIVAFRQNPTGIRLVQVDRDKRIDRLVTCARMVLTHSDPQVVPDPYDPISISKRAVGCQWFGSAHTRPKPIQPLVRVVSEVKRAVGNRPCTAAVFMDSRPYIKRWRHKIAVRDHHTASRLMRTTFQPIRLTSIKPNLGKTD